MIRSKFVAEDEAVNLLRQDVHEIEHLLLKDLSEDNSGMNMLRKKFWKLSRDMETVEHHFAKLKSDFNTFLLDAA
jgi:hypothetical protein